MKLTLIKLFSFSLLLMTFTTFTTFAKSGVLDKRLNSDEIVIDNLADSSYTASIQMDKQPKSMIFDSTFLEKSAKNKYRTIKVGQEVRIKMVVEIQKRKRKRTSPFNPYSDSITKRITKKIWGNIKYINEGEFVLSLSRPRSKISEQDTVAFSDLYEIKLLNGSNRALGGFVKFVGATAAGLGGLIVYGLYGAGLNDATPIFWAAGAGGVGLWILGRKMKNSRKYPLGKSWKLSQQ